MLKIAIDDAIGKKVIVFLQEGEKEGKRVCKQEPQCG
jgi:hypothetical protein